MEEIIRPKIGVGVIIRKDGKFLLGKRKGNHGGGYWAFPGGHLEMNESIEECAEREVMEETGLVVKNFKKLTFTNDVFLETKKHYVTLFVVTDYQGGEVKIMEPDKCEEWDWFGLDNLPSPLFLPIQNFLREKVDPFKI